MTKELKFTPEEMQQVHEWADPNYNPLHGTAKIKREPVKVTDLTDAQQNLIIVACSVMCICTWYVLDLVGFLMEKAWFFI